MFRNIEVSLPDPPVAGLVAGFSNRVWMVEFEGQANWFYVLERSDNFQTWAVITSTTLPEKGRVRLEDSGSDLLSQGYYRVRSERP